MNGRPKQKGALAKNVLGIGEWIGASIFVLQIRSATSTRRHVSFSLVDAKTGKLGKQCDAKKFGFFVEPQHAMAVLKLVGRQVQSDNAKLARVQRLRAITAENGLI